MATQSAALQGGGADDKLPREGGFKWQSNEHVEVGLNVFFSYYASVDLHGWVFDVIVYFVRSILNHLVKSPVECSVSWFSVFCEIRPVSSGIRANQAEIPDISPVTSIGASVSLSKGDSPELLRFLLRFTHPKTRKQSSQNPPHTTKPKLLNPPSSQSLSTPFRRPDSSSPPSKPTSRSRTPSLLQTSDLKPT
ncbi:hypothetical protein M5K25_004579 [Dendrobium thyrsiflorum]|uniref:Uncharacterized protein n=1 Tax=Dendrobium thyrsiflorum TaxID=117978 RepID=A0ABD0VFI4_DENTH